MTSWPNTMKPSPVRDLPASARLMASKRSIRLAGIGWGADFDRWQKLAEIEVRESLKWKKVLFLENRKEKIPEHDAGIYLICAGPPRVSLFGKPPLGALAQLKPYNILYAGQTQRSLRARFLRHIKRPSPKLAVYLKCYNSIHFWYTVIEEPETIDDMEKLLIDSLGPPCNSIHAPRAAAVEARLGITQKIGPPVARAR